ncbi:kinase-like protein [Atractiella rhizophila]|nr:kinase-like protein [Atractiella rhizophila]
MSNLSLLLRRPAPVMAVKVCPKEKIRDARFIRDEFRTLLCIGNSGSHPLIARPFGAFQDYSNAFFVSEFVNGGELFRLMDQHWQEFQNPDFARFYLAEIVAVTEWLHSRGIIHRDIKPENVLIAADGHIKLVDFGKATHIYRGQKIELDCAFGTVEYMSPELANTHLELQALDWDIQRYVIKDYPSTAADWWAVGTMAFEMAFSHRPFIPKTFIQSLLVKDPFLRLSSPNQESATAHPFFRGLDWAAVVGKHLEPPINVAGRLRLEEKDTTLFDNGPDYEEMGRGIVFGELVDMAYGAGEDMIGEEYECAFIYPSTGNVNHYLCNSDIFGN